MKLHATTVRYLVHHRVHSCPKTNELKNILSPLAFGCTNYRQRAPNTQQRLTMAEDMQKKSSPRDLRLLLGSQRQSKLSLVLKNQPGLAATRHTTAVTTAL